MSMDSSTDGMGKALANAKKIDQVSGKCKQMAILIALFVLVNNFWNSKTNRVKLIHYQLTYSTKNTLVSRLLHKRENDVFSIASVEYTGLHQNTGHPASRFDFVLVHFSWLVSTVWQSSLENLLRSTYSGKGPSFSAGKSTWFCSLQM